MSYEIEKIRNLGIIAHIDAGKTTVSERVLYYADFMHRVGSVDEGTTVTDYDDEEQERGITIYSVSVTFNWNGCTVNMIDTPGHVDFTAEVERCLRVLDGAIVVFSAREGVEAQSETVWRQADKYNVPRIAFVNKMDREGADFYATVTEIKKRLTSNPVVLTLPVGAGPSHLKDPFRATVDLIRMKMLTFDQEQKGRVIETTEIPAELREEAELWRSQMLDQLSTFSDEITELLLAEEDVPEELIHRVLRDATIHALCVPVLCGTALHYIRVQPLMDAAMAYLPSPLDIPAVEGMVPVSSKSKTAGGEMKKASRKADPKEPFCGLVFKINPSKHGDLAFVRIYSGTLKQGTRVLNVGHNEKENVSQVFRLLAGHKDQLKESVYAGDIVGILGLNHTMTGDTIADTGNPILLESIDFPETVISMSIEPETTAERKKLDEALTLMQRQDPTFSVTVNAETGQTLIGGMGELHLEIIKHKILREHKINVHVRPPCVSYRETIKTEATVESERSIRVGENTLSARVKVQVEPLPIHEKAVIVEAQLPPDTLCPPTLVETLLENLRDQTTGGYLLGYPMTRVKVTLLDVVFPDSTNDSTAAVIATLDAFRQAIQKAGMDLLEPVMKLEILSPEDNVGDIVSDLQQRRASVNRIEVRGRYTVIQAEAPLTKLFGYSNAIKGLSQGLASYSMEPYAYLPAPKEILDELMG